MRLINADVLIDGYEENYEFCEAVNNTPTIPAIPMERIKQLREDVEQLKLVGYATVDGKRQIASRAVFDLLDNMIKEYSE